MVLLDLNEKALLTFLFDKIRDKDEEERRNKRKRFTKHITKSVLCKNLSILLC